MAVTRLPNWWRLKEFSKPKRPPPMTTTSVTFSLKRRIFWASVIERSVNTPSLSMPSMGGTNGREPVAMSRWS